MSELNLKVIKQESPVIEINFEEIKKSLTESIAEYKALVVTEQTLPICKAKQRELAGIRNSIDEERLRIKKEMAKPIDAFEVKCKQLVKLVEEAEQPLKDGIKVFDDMKRDEKRNVAEGIIKAVIEEHGLTEKYAKQRPVSDKYTLLGAKVSEVKDDVEQRAFLLLEQQNKEKEMLELIQDAIDTANKTIKKQVDISSVQWMINRGMSTREIIQSINSLAKQIWDAENPPAPQPESEPKQEQKPAPSQPPVVDKGKEEPTYFVELRIEETFAGIERLSNVLKSNGFEYEVLSKGKVK
jgi:hypothetical protein